MSYDKKAYSKAYRASYPEMVMFVGAKCRAKKQGRPFNLKVTDIFIPEFCPILGIKLKSGGPPGPTSASLDCVNPLAGYVIGNVWVISQLANAMKQNATPDQLVRFASWILETFGENPVWQSLPVATFPSQERIAELMSLPKLSLQ